MFDQGAKNSSGKIEDRMGGGYLLKGGYQAARLIARSKRETEREKADRLASSGYANKANYLNTAVHSNTDQSRFRREGAFQPIYAHITVHPEHGAGIGFQYDPQGWKVVTVKPIPGQKEIMIDDLILEIEGKSIVGKSTADQAAVFKQYFRNNAVLKIQRDHYCSLTNNKESVKRQYEIEGFGDKALRDYNNNPFTRKNRFMDDYDLGKEDHGTGKLNLKHSKMDTIRFVQRLPQTRDVINKPFKTIDQRGAGRGMGRGGGAPMTAQMDAKAKKEAEIAAKFANDDGACWRPD